MNDQELNDDLRIIERVLSRKEYNESIDRATRNLSVDVLANMPTRRGFVAWKYAAVLVPVATAVLVWIAPWKSDVPVTPQPIATTAVASVVPMVTVQQPTDQVSAVKHTRVSRGVASASATVVSEERLLSDVYNEQLVSGLSESIQSSQPAMFELTSQDLRLLSTSVNNENSF